jgi:hypothetical protein
MSFERARKIADAVLYEGYILYPYRPSATKNRFRWQFGVVAPREWSGVGGDPWEMQTECLVEPGGSPLLEIAIRFLQVHGPVEWEKGVERTIEFHRINLEQLAACGRDEPFEIPGEPPITGVVRLAAGRLDGLWKLRVRIENHTPFANAAETDRGAAMRHALVGCHTLLGITCGAFVSLIDPGLLAHAAAQSCSNLHTWPVLVGSAGERETMLSSPIILEDYPTIAPESQGDFYDAAEIDELLTLRVMTLTEEEKREASASDERARRIIERCDNTPPEMFERLHGAIRAQNRLKPVPPGPEALDGGTGFSLAAGETGFSLSRGDRVRLTPKHRADSMDFFLAGRSAVVETIERDFEDRVYVAVTVEDDPAADIQSRVGRFFYFYPDELELIGKER